MRAGHVYKRGSTWTYLMDVSPPGSPRQQRSKGGFRTKADALDALNASQRAFADGAYVGPQKLTVTDYLEDRWIPAMEGTGIRATTLRSYRMHTAQHIRPRIGDIQLQALTADRINALYGDLLTDGRADGSGGLSPATVRRCHAMLRKALADAVKWQLLVRNPADSADPPRPNNSGHVEMATWTADELRTFLAHVADDRLAPLWTLLAMTGVRRGEALGLRWKDVDLETGRISIRQTLIAVGYDVQVGQPKTKRGRRSVALDPGTVATLRSWQARRQQEQMAWGQSALAREGLVFTREDGDHLHPDRVSKLFDGHVSRIMLPRIRLHDLRHTHASLALAAGVNPKVVSDRLGHATVSMTLDVYSHVIPALQEDAAAAVAALVSGPPRRLP